MPNSVQVSASEPGYISSISTFPGWVGGLGETNLKPTQCSKMIDTVKV